MENVHYPLVQFSSEEDQRNDDGAMIYMGSHQLHTIAMLGYLDMGLRLLKDGQVSVDEFDSYGDTPLMIAIRQKQFDFVKLLLRYRADPNKVGKNGVTPLHCAVYTNQPMLIECLQAYNANPKITDDLGRTPLHAAASEGKLQCIVALLRYHSTLVDQDDARLMTAMHCAMRSRCHDTTQLEICKQLIRQGSSLDKVDQLRKTPIFYAIQTGKEACLKELVDAGASCHHICLNRNTPFLVAAKTNALSIMYKLLENGTSIHQRNRYDESALHLSLMFP